MTLHVCVLGIDGSGKTSVAAALPRILAAEMNFTAVSAGESFSVVAPDEDHLTANLYPDRLPLSARLSMRFKRLAKRLVNQPRLYPAVKFAQMLWQDTAAQELGERYYADCIVSDGNAVLSAAGRWANYLRPASNGHSIESSPDAEDLRTAFSYIFDNKAVPVERQSKLPQLRKAQAIYRLTRLLHLRAMWLPDVVIFLDLAPDTALSRIASRGRQADRHENLADMHQAREMYLKTLAAFQQYRATSAVYCIDTNNLSPEETLKAILQKLRPHMDAQATRASSSIASKMPLGTTKTNKRAMIGKALNSRYIVRYLLPKWFRGAWREPFFFFSRSGRLFLKEGYSAGVMRAIYEHDAKPCGPLDRAFMNYELHHAVYDRLQILVKRIEAALEIRLKDNRKVTILTAPSGYADDIFRALESLATRRPDSVRKINLVAADLDPHGVLARELQSRAAKLGIEFQFHRGDLTSDQTRAELERAAPYDLVLFVGLSSWLPKPQFIRHLQWIKRNTHASGILISDCFTPATYALSGRHVNYKAQYYTAQVYKTLLDYCGFDGLSAEVDSGRDEINHVLLASPRVKEKKRCSSSVHKAA